VSALSYSQPTLRVRRIVTESAIGDFACFAMPALAFLHVELGGVLYATDLCLLAVLPFVFERRKWLEIKPARAFLYLGLMWLVGQVVTDVMRQSPFEDYSRGWSKIALTLTHFSAIALLIRQSQKRLILYGVGLGVGGILTFFIAPGQYAKDYPWKFGMGLPITILLCLLAGTVARRSRIAAVTILAGIGTINLCLGFRALGVVCGFAAVYTYFQLSSRLADGRSPKLRTILTITILVAGAWGISTVYAYGAQSGWFGADEREKYAVQSSGIGGVLLGGRSDLLASSAAIVDSPLLGHGSWARDPMYGAILVDDMEDLGYENSIAGLEGDLIPSHSYLFGAWVESGIAGAVFWCWVLWFTASALIRSSGQEPLLPLFAFVGTFLIWNVLFSPYGADGRFTATYFVYAMIFFSLHSNAQRTDVAL
jgi:hypothetical protein